MFHIPAHKNATAPAAQAAIPSDDRPDPKYGREYWENSCTYWEESIVAWADIAHAYKGTPYAEDARRNKENAEARLHSARTCLSLI